MRRDTGDEAPLEQPSRSTDARSTERSRDEFVPVVERAGKGTIDDNMPMIAQALAYSTFMAIPAVLLVVLGLSPCSSDRPRSRA